MKYKKEDIIKIVKGENIKSIRLAFCDVYGNEKNIAVMPEELNQALDYGVSINASAIKDFGEGVLTDLVLHPELDTVSMLPWRPDTDPVLRIFCSMTHPDGTPFTERGTKSVLMAALKKAEQYGVEFFFGTSLKFYLFKLDENGYPTKIPYDEAHYLDIPPEDKCEGIRREICKALENMDIKAMNAYHEAGPGQNVIDFGFSNPLSAGNNIVTLKGIVKNAAFRHGLYADFSPKPLSDKQGNGFHVTISVRGNDGTDSETERVVAGVLEKIRDMTLFLNPTKESYERIGRSGAPKYVSWSTENRFQLMRLPALIGKYKRSVLNSPDGMANPYLVFALIIHAGLYGIENDLKLPEASNFDMDSADLSVLANYQKLPTNYEDACRIARESDFIREVVPKDILNIYSSKK